VVLTGCILRACWERRRLSGFLGKRQQSSNLGIWQFRKRLSADQRQQLSNIATWQLRKITRWWSGRRRDWVAVFAIWIGIQRASGGLDTGSPFRALAGMPVGWAAFWLVFRLLGSVVTAPIAEELAFRGYLLRRLISADFDRLPFPVLPVFLFPFLSAIRCPAWQLAGWHSGRDVLRLGALPACRVADAIVAHATTNALIAAVVLISKNGSLG